MIDESTTFGAVPDGREVRKYTLINARGFSVDAITLGCRITRIAAPDRDGCFSNVVLCCDTLEGYLRDDTYLGACVGRMANFIGGSVLRIEGREYRVDPNYGLHSLHGGFSGFHQAIWEVADAGPDFVTFTHFSPAGEGGYPGAVEMLVRYELGEKNDLSIRYMASADAVTPLNPTNHCYFNLSGDPRRNIRDHVLQLRADRYTETAPDGIPTGRLPAASGTPFDFSVAKKLGRDLDDPGLAAWGGYDVNYTLCGDDREPVAVLNHPACGRVMTMYTDMPGLQLYTSNEADPSAQISGAEGLFPHQAVCLETQYYPDAPNHTGFPYALLQPGEIWQSTTRYVFDVAE